MTRGWWRRNRWGLLLLVPVIGLGLAEPVHDQWHAFWAGAPRTPVHAAAGGWVTLGANGMRLDSLAPASGFTDDFGNPVALPSGMAVWRASITFRAANLSELYGCDVRMVDTAGTTYDFNPAELGDAGVYPGIASCTPDSSGATQPASWTTVAYFVAPVGTRPASVRVLIEAEQPKYAVLTR